MAGSLGGSRTSEVRRQKAQSAQMEEATARGWTVLNRFAVCLLQRLTCGINDRKERTAACVCQSMTAYTSPERCHAHVQISRPVM